MFSRVILGHFLVVLGGLSTHTGNNSFLEGLSFHHEGRDEVRELNSLHEAVRSFPCAGTAGSTRGEETVYQAADKPHPPRNQDENQKPNDTKAHFFGSSHL